MRKNLLVLFSVILLTSVIFAQVPPPTLQSGEKWTKLYSATYDYQTNGSVRYFHQDPTSANNLFIIMMAVTDSTDASTFTGRGTYFAYSSDGGNTWDTARVAPFPTRTGFPASYLANGIPIVADHQGGTPLVIKVWKDISFAGFGFAAMTGVPTYTPALAWPHIAGSVTGNQIVVIASNNVTNGPYPGQRAVYNGTTWSASWTQLDNLSGPSGNYSAFSGPGGKFGLVGFNYDSSTANLYNSTLWYYQSNDNGATWLAPQVVFTHVVEGADSIIYDITCGISGAFDASGNPHVMFGAYASNTSLTINGPDTVDYLVKNRIYHWSPSGGATIAIDKNNNPQVSDSLRSILITPRGGVALGRLANGNLVISWTGFTRGHTQVVDNGSKYSTGDIYMAWSANNGATWGNVVQVTNTNGVEERYSSVLPVSSDNKVRVNYLRDLKAAGFVNTPALGKAPVYSIFKEISVFGIQEDLQTAREFRLFQNYPNPFNPSTTISYYVALRSFVTIKVFDVLGKEVASLVNTVENAGAKQITFNASNLPSGVYFYTITAGNFTDSKKMTLIK